MKETSVGAPARTARLFTKKYGFDKFMRLLELFAKNESGEVIAEEFNFSRQRVHQLRHRLGTTQFMYAVDGGVQDFIRAQLKP